MKLLNAKRHLTHLRLSMTSELTMITSLFMQVCHKVGIMTKLVCCELDAQNATWEEKGRCNMTFSQVWLKTNNNNHKEKKQKQHSG